MQTQQISLGDILPSPFNYRRTFTGLDELAALLKEKGLVSPITVRPAPKGRSKPPYELVVGERRWKATGIAKLDTIECFVRNMSDKDVLELQLVENVQRVDVHAIDEAEGFDQLIKKHEHTVETLAAKLGKPAAYVRQRLKLCELGPVVRKAALEDRVPLGVVMKIARIADHKLQAEALGLCLGEGDWDDYRGTGIERPDFRAENDKGNEVREVRVLSVREAEQLLRRKYMLRLELAPFDIADATLVPKAGACTACPKRTGNQRELFADVKSPDLCSDPTCFEAKKAADWDRKSAAATRAGVRVLNDKETDKVFQDHSYGGKVGIQHNSAYVDPSDELPYDLQTTGKRTWKSLLGKATPATALAQDGTGATRTLWDKQSAIATAKKSGAIKEAKAEKAARARAPDQYQLAQRKRAAEGKKRHEIARVAFAKLRAVKPTLDVKFWRWLAAAALRMMDLEDQNQLAKRHGCDVERSSGKAEKGMLAIVAKAELAELPGLVVEFVAGFRAVGGLWGGENYGKNFSAACELFRINLAKLKAEQAAADKSKKAAKKKGKK